MLILENATLCDLAAGELRPAFHVAVENDAIVEVSDQPIAAASATRIDLEGRCLLPGLIDAHFHATITESNPAALRDLPATLMTARAGRLLRDSLVRGFTTVRDMGGADWGLRAALEEGTLPGPRLFIAGRALSQTGGHGDLRKRTDTAHVCGCEHALAMMSTVADGKAGVQLAAREQLRQGADHLKVFVSGGVVSETDPLSSAQYTDEELAAVVHEAASWGKYVAAHAYTSDSILRAVATGVRTIEHGNLLNGAAAALMAERGAMLIPTLITYEVMHRKRVELGLGAAAMDKLETVLEAGLRSVELALGAGVKVGFGTDLLGELHQFQSEEFLLRSRVQRPHEVIAAATTVNAEIIGMTGKLGCIAPGAFADLIAVNGNPMRDVTLLQDAGRHLPFIMKAGKTFKNELRR
jgi:imidazolonepropionase-like amidohydrolase